MGVGPAAEALPPAPVTSCCCSCPHPPSRYALIPPLHTSPHKPPQYLPSYPLIPSFIPPVPIDPQAPQSQKACPHTISRRYCLQVVGPHHPHSKLNCHMPPPCTPPRSHPYALKMYTPQMLPDDRPLYPLLGFLASSCPLNKPSHPAPLPFPTGHTPFRSYLCIASVYRDACRAGALGACRSVAVLSA